MYMYKAGERLAMPGLNTRMGVLIHISLGQAVGATKRGGKQT